MRSASIWIAFFICTFPGLPDSRPAIVVALENSDMNAFRTQLADVDPNMTYDRYTLMGRAIMLGEHDAIKILIAQGAAVNLYTPFIRTGKPARTPLCLAIIESRAKIATTLLQAGADINRKCDVRYPLPDIFASPSSATIRRVSAPVKNSTALIIAANMGFSAMVSDLLAHGAEPDARDSFQNNAAERALIQGHLDLFTSLLLQTKTTKPFQALPKDSFRREKTYASVSPSPAGLKNNYTGLLRFWSGTPKHSYVTAKIAYLHGTPVWASQFDLEGHSMKFCDLRKRTQTKLAPDCTEFLTWTMKLLRQKIAP